jgi:hypothetical protein
MLSIQCSTSTWTVLPLRAVEEHSWEGSDESSEVSATLGCESWAEPSREREQDAGAHLFPVQVHAEKYR